ncbi:MAG: hypothetical protein F6K03_14355, partial [Kamptonema sp. SIO4C4]|nr:hypothetical protein [Kamptonema sp. SIO4C4]
MKYNQLFLKVLGGTVGLCLCAGTANAVTLTHISSDQEMNGLMDDIAFVAEGRIGDLDGFATHELNLHESDPGQPDITDQFNWQNGVTEQFELSYDATSQLVNFNIGDRTLTHTYDDPFSDIFLRTRAVNEGSDIRVDNLLLDGVALNDASHAVAETGGLDILRIADIDENFTLTGDATMNWEDSPPSQSRLAFQVKISEPSPEPPPHKEIPEPSTVISLF